MFKFSWRESLHILYQTIQIVVSGNMSFSGGTEDMVANNVGAGFVGALVHMGTHQSFVNIIHFVPHLLIFVMTLFIGALAGVLSFSTLFLSFFVSCSILVGLQVSLTFSSRNYKFPSSTDSALSRWAHSSRLDIYVWKRYKLSVSFVFKH